MSTLTGYVDRHHPRLRAQAEHMAAETIGRAYEAWLDDPGKEGRGVLPYLMVILKNLANDAYRVPSLPADEGTMKDIERHILARPARSSDLPLSFGSMTPHSPIEPMDELIKPAISRMKPTQRKTVAEMQSCGMDDQAIAEHMNRGVAVIQTLKSKAAEELRADTKLRLHIRDEEPRKTRRQDEGEGE
ncbi:RNA polymerase sigma factor [Streptomyces sp. NBC_01431]|uniref:RNA polymerase sigma factor n=1 Tax=Streptomyces sp. NBC_01431 TaxID=2903863 RepID=UPI002E2ED127|nr:hypothetical protein [Streptomyces sp. NBC_01431]